MALAVDLMGMDADGNVAWSWMARNWDGHVVAKTLELAPGEWPESWQGTVTEQQVGHIRSLFGGRNYELYSELPGNDLDELLQRPRASLLLCVEDWGST